MKISESHLGQNRIFSYAQIISLKIFINMVVLTYVHKLCGASQVALVVKNLPANVGDVRDASSIPGSGRSPGEGHGNPF